MPNISLTDKIVLATLICIMLLAAYLLVTQ